MSFDNYQLNWKYRSIIINYFNIGLCRKTVLFALYHYQKCAIFYLRLCSYCDGEFNRINNNYYSLICMCKVNNI